MINPFQPKIYIKLKRSLYAIISLILISFIFFVTQFSETSNQKRWQELGRILKNNYFIELNEFLFQKINSPYLNISHRVKKNEKIVSILKNYNINQKDIAKASKELKKFNKLRNLKSGVILEITVKRNIKKGLNLENLVIPISKSINISLARNTENNFTSKKVVTQLFKKIVLSQGVIERSLYASAMKDNVNPNIIVGFAQIYGFEIDFQRDIRKGDTFQILYEQYVDEDGEWYSNGEIIYAFMSVQNREIILYRYQTKKFYGYFNINGKSVEKALMKTPINGARLSSSFGMRKHPILGYNKLHRGTDFAAPMGTPIMASGTGVVTKASWCGGGGNCVKIKHNSTYQTIYAHLSNFGAGIKKGKKIRQGQIIGYVGSTGMSTGPHLHYEVIVNGKKINSQKLNLPSGKILKGENRKKFEIQRIKTDVLLAETLEKKS